MRATIHHGRWLACKITTNLNNYTTFSKPISFATSRSLSVISVYSITTRDNIKILVYRKREKRRPRGKNSTFLRRKKSSSGFILNFTFAGRLYGREKMLPTYTPLPQHFCTIPSVCTLFFRTFAHWNGLFRLPKQAYALTEIEEMAGCHSASF